MGGGAERGVLLGAGARAGRGGVAGGVAEGGHDGVEVVVRVAAGAGAPLRGRAGRHRLRLQLEPGLQPRAPRPGRRAAAAVEVILDERGLLAVLALLRARHAQLRHEEAAGRGHGVPGGGADLHLVAGGRGVEQLLQHLLLDVIEAGLRPAPPRAVGGGVQLQAPVIRTFFLDFEIWVKIRVGAHIH